MAEPREQAAKDGTIPPRPATAASPPADGPATSVPGKRSRWRRVLKWVALFIALACVMIGVGAWWLWTQRDQVASWWLKRQSWGVDVAELKLRPQEGAISAQEITWHPKNRPAKGVSVTSVTARQVRVSGEARPWLHRQFGGVTADHVEIRLTGQSAPSTQSPPTSPPWAALDEMVKIDHLQAADVQVHLDDVDGWRGLVRASVERQALRPPQITVRGIDLTGPEGRRVIWQGPQPLQLPLTPEGGLSLDNVALGTPVSVTWPVVLPQMGAGVVSAEVMPRVKHLEWRPQDLTSPLQLTGATLQAPKLKVSHPGTQASVEGTGLTIDMDHGGAGAGTTLSRVSVGRLVIDLPLLALKTWPLAPASTPPQPGTPTTSADAAMAKKASPMTLGAIDIQEFECRLPGWKRGALPAPWPAEIPQFQISGSFTGAGESQQAQCLRIRGGELPPAAPPEPGAITSQLRWGDLELRWVPQTWAERRELEQLTVGESQFRLTPDLLQALSPALTSQAARPTAPVTTPTEPGASVATETPAKTPSDAEAKPEKPASPPPWPWIKKCQIAATELSLQGFSLPWPTVDAVVSVAPDDGEKEQHHLTVEKLRLAGPEVLTAQPLTTREIARIEKIQARIDPTRFRQHRFPHLSIEGAAVTFGPALQSVLAALPQAAPGEADTIGTPPPQVKRDPWLVEQLSVTRSQATLSGIVPLMPELTIPLAAQLSDVPLTPEGLRQQHQPQRIEIGRMPLYTAYGSAAAALYQPIAEFQSNFIHFTFAGLMERRLNKVEIVSPRLMVGQRLFWWVDYVRRYAATGVKPPTQLAATSDAVALQALTAQREAAKDKGWTIGLIEAQHGRLKIDLPGGLADLLPDLPFQAQTEMLRGSADLSLVVPPGTYRPIKNVPLEIDVTEGLIVFNYPLKEKDNNLVQTFKVKEIRFQKYSVQDVWLSMTFDEKGIYGKFGGNTYGGYTDGGFDLYFDAHTSWDAWLSVTDLDLEPFSQKCFPTYAQLAGKGGLQVRAWGNIKSLYRATATLTGKPGSLHLLCLDPLKDKFPAEWPLIKRRFAEIGIETLRTYHFDSCVGTADFHGAEGVLDLKLSGPEGQRHFSAEVKAR